MYPTFVQGTTEHLSSYSSMLFTGLKSICGLQGASLYN